MPEAGTSSTKAPKQISLRLACVLIGLSVLLSSLVTDLICWPIASNAAQAKATADMQLYLQNNDTSQSTTYRRLADGWTRTLATMEGDVVFYGDSLTAGGAWEEYYPYLTSINLGVVGDTLYGLTERMPQIEALMCEKCFVMIGVNDLCYGSTVENTLQFYEGLLQKLAAVCNDTGMQVYVQSVLPVEEAVTVYPIHNADIRRLNDGIQTLAQTYGMTYIDVHSSMTDQSGSLEHGYTKDGLHLNEAGYDIWQQVLIPYLDE